MLKIDHEVAVYRCTGNVDSDGGTDGRKSEYGHQGTKKEKDAKAMRRQRMKET
jgi:hypothetical protein